MDAAIEAKLTEYTARTGDIVAAAGSSKGDGTWTASMIVGHLTDAVRVNLGRLHAKALGGTPVPNWAQEAMVEQFAYASIPVHHISAEFQARREAFVTAARTLLGSGLDPAYVVERLDGTRDHDIEHLEQLRGR